MIVKPEDFTGERYIPNACSDNELQWYIDEYEPYYLCRLLGKELYDLFIADLVDGVPTNPDYLLWFDPFCSDDCLAGIGGNSYYRMKYRGFYSKGVKVMLLNLIYYHYVSNFNEKLTLTGFETHKKEVANPLSKANVAVLTLRRYNDGVATFNLTRLTIDPCNQFPQRDLKVTTVFI